MGDFPMMTDRGTFIINGTERIVVSQLVRSPGVYFGITPDKTQPEKDVVDAKIIPGRGAWLEFEVDKKDVCYVRIDRKRKQPITDPPQGARIRRVRRRAAQPHPRPAGQPVRVDPQHPREGQHRRPSTRRSSTSTASCVPGEPPTPDSARQLLENLFFNPKRYDMAKVGRHKVSKKLRDEYAQARRSRKLDLTVPNADPEKGPLDFQLSKADILATVSYLVKLHNNDPDYYRDDIDHFGNRRVRSVGELIQNQVRVGLSRMERVVRERMTTQDVEAITPQTLINIRPVVAAIKEFFGSSQLSQFMDQTNPLAGLTHKRRLSALGPGGLSRERAGFEVRDVHPSHYGRMCPIETPEGPNIGLIGYLSTYARINRFGFIETPYRKVTNGRATNTIDYLAADDEDRYVIAQANAQIDAQGNFQSDRRCSCAPAAVRSSSSTRTRSTTWTSRRSRSSRWPPRSSRSSSTTTPTARSWAPTCSARPCRSCAPPRRSSAPASRRARRATPATSCSPRATAPSSTSTARRSRSTTPTARRRRSRTGSTSSAGRTRAPASTRSRSSTSATRSSRATSSPTARRPTRASSRWARTCSSRSCRGRATTSRTRS